MKRLSALFALLFLTACAVKSTGPTIDPPPPPPAATFQLFVHVCDGEPCEPGNETHKRPGAAVNLDVLKTGLWDDGQADDAGNRIITGLAAGEYQVCAEAQGFVKACAPVTLPRPDGDVFLLLVRDVIPVDRVHVDGKVFRDTSGAIWPYRGATSFLLLKRFAAGEDIVPYLDHRRDAGANILRVLTNVSWGPLAPTDYTDVQLRQFLALVHSRGLRVEVVALADALNWSLAQQRAHVQRVLDAVADMGALDFVEVSNEAFKNSKPPAEVMAGVTRRRPDLVMAAGGDNATCDNLTPFVLDYVTLHNERKDEWPRTAKDELELRDGFGCGDKPGYGGAHVPVVSDEPMGAAEANEPGRRSNVADDFYWFAATSQLLGAGGTFHSEAGLTASEPGPAQAAAEQAFFAGLSSVAPAAQLGLYTRGGLASVPLTHDDAKALRTFCSIQGGTADCVVIRPSADWAAQAVNGWRIVSQAGPRGSRVTVQR
jgi:hypothetical protein